VPPRGLPGNANLEQLKKGARSFQRAVRAGDGGAAEVVREFHPRLGHASVGSPELAAFSRADAQLVVARQFAFPSWAKLKVHLELIERFSRSPHDQPIGGPLADEQALADEFLRLACLTYGGDDPGRWARAAELLDAHPELARASIHTIASAGDAAAARELLAGDASLARVQGGPYAWEPLMYLTYSRLAGPVPQRSPIDVARLLLDYGGDPNAGYLWEGLSPPFTVLTGVFGRGESGAPAHRDELALARLLLEGGADPNDAQTLYNLHWHAQDDWLELLFEFGLGTGDGGAWHRLLAPRHPTPRQMLEDQMMAAAHHGFVDRVRLLLDHGVDPDGRGTRHPIYKARTPSQEAAFYGYRSIVELLAAAGATPRLDALDAFVSACMAGDRALSAAMLAGDPTLAERAIVRGPDQLARAAEKNSVEAARLLIELGFDVDAMNRAAPLHEAAIHGNLELIRLLLEHGADPCARDPSYDATPAGWAEHHGQTAAARYLGATHHGP